MKVLLVFVCLLAAECGWAEDGSEQIESFADRIWSVTGAPDLKKIRERIREWDQAVLGFRRQHNFSILLGPARGRWRYKRFNNQINKKYSDSGYMTKARYSYHEPLYEGFGYYLGSAFGYWQPTDSAADMSLQSAAMLPGVVAGFVLNITPGFRLLTGVEFYLERWNSLAENDDSDEDSRISVTSRAFDIMVGIDIFFQLKWSIRIEAHKRQVNFVRADESGGKEVDALVDREDEALLTGLLYHLM